MRPATMDRQAATDCGRWRAGHNGGDADLCRDLSVGHHASSFNYEFTSDFGGIADHARTCRWLNRSRMTHFGNRRFNRNGLRNLKDFVSAEVP